MTNIKNWKANKMNYMLKWKIIKDTNNVVGLIGRVLNKNLLNLKASNVIISVTLFLYCYIECSVFFKLELFMQRIFSRDMFATKSLFIKLDAF